MFKVTQPLLRCGPAGRPCDRSQVCELWIGPCRIDPYGFERPHDYESYKEMMNDYVAVLNRRSLRWSRLLQESPHVEKNLTGEGSPPPPQHICVFMETSGSLSK